MGKLKNNQKGFSAIEILLALIFIAIVAFIGVYVAHNHNTAKKSSATTTSSSNKSTPPTTSLTLAQAISQVNYVYTSYENEVLNGQTLLDKSQWASNNVSAAEDLQFINNHKTWFTPAFVSWANNYEATNTSPPGGGFLMCVSGSADFNSNSFLAQGVTESGTVAHLNLTYNVGGSEGQGTKTNYSLPMTVKVSDANIWAIDSIDLSSCGN